VQPLATSEFSNALVVPPDTTPPTVTEARFRYDRRPNRLSVTFSENVGDSIEHADFVVTHLGSGAVYKIFAISWNGARADLDFKSEVVLPDGDYRLTIDAEDVADSAGNPLPADFAFDFFVMAGDINRDRAVDFADLVVVAQNYGGTGKTFATGDLTADGKTDFADLVILSQNYGAALPPPVVAAPASAAPLKSADELLGESAAKRPVFRIASKPTAKPSARRPARS
jgi:hypothetical protein